MSDHQHIGVDADTTGARPPRTDDGLYGISLDLLRDLLRDWHHHWEMVDAEMQELPDSTKRNLLQLPTEPRDGLRAARRTFAESFHPDVVTFLRTHLDAAAQTVDQLLRAHQRTSSGVAADPADLERRVRRLETILGGVGAVLGVLEAPHPEDPR